MVNIVEGLFMVGIGLRRTKIYLGVSSNKDSVCMVEYLSIHIRGNFRRQRVPQVGLESLQIIPPHLYTMGYPLALKKNMQIFNECNFQCDNSFICLISKLVRKIKFTFVKWFLRSPILTWSIMQNGRSNQRHLIIH